MLSSFGTGSSACTYSLIDTVAVAGGSSIILLSGLSAVGPRCRLWRWRRRSLAGPPCVPPTPSACSSSAVVAGQCLCPTRLSCAAGS